DRAWISQEVVKTGSLGDPRYVGFSAIDPDFSRLDLGVVVSKAEIKISDFIADEYLIYLTIFGILGSVFAVLLDRRERGRFWSAQSWFLRLISWPVLLLSAGNLILDFAVQNLATAYIDMIVAIYATLWWLIPARLITMAVERFIWQPLED